MMMTMMMKLMPALGDCFQIVHSWAMSPAVVYSIRNDRNMYSCVLGETLLSTHDWFSMCGFRYLGCGTKVILCEFETLL